jgi:hypothetical protein
VNNALEPPDAEQRIVNDITSQPTPATLSASYTSTHKNRLEYSSSDEDDNKNDDDDDDIEDTSSSSSSNTNQRTPTNLHERGGNNNNNSSSMDITRSSPRANFQRSRRRLSTFESNDGGMDLESDVIGGSARSVPRSHASASAHWLGHGHGRVVGNSPRRSWSGE